MAKAPPMPAGPRDVMVAGRDMGGYLVAVERRFLAGGGFGEAGAGRTWTRPRIPPIRRRRQSAGVRVGREAVVAGDRLIHVAVGLVV